MKSFTCININKNTDNQVISYELQDCTGETLQISYNKLKIMLESNKIQVVNLMLKNSEIVEDSSYQLKNMIAKFKMLGKTYKSACGHEYYVIESPDTTIVYIPDDVEYLIVPDPEDDMNDESKPDFYNIRCKTLKMVGGSGLTSTYHMFFCCEAQSLDLSSLDTSKVTNMQAMFGYCKAQSLGTKLLDTSKVTDMRQMFGCCEAQSLDLSSFDTSKVTNMELMFCYCEAQSLDLSSFDTSKVINMYQMFLGCEAQSLDLSSFDTSNVTDMCGMFRGCAAQSLDLNSFDTSKVTDMRNMFWGCEAQSIDLSSFDTSKVIKMDFMFAFCKAQVKTTDNKILEEYRDRIRS